MHSSHKALQDKEQTPKLESCPVVLKQIREKLISLCKHEVIIDGQDVSKKLGFQDIDLLVFALNTEDLGDIEDQVCTHSTGLHKLPLILPMVGQIAK